MAPCDGATLWEAFLNDHSLDLEEEAAFLAWLSRPGSVYDLPLTRAELARQYTAWREEPRP
jgi:hypothetical protein